MAASPCDLSSALGLGHPEEPLPDVRRADAASRESHGPDGVAEIFQVMTYSGEPSTSSLARNLFTNNSVRTALGDQPMKSGP